MEFFIGIGIQILIFIVLASCFNLLYGYTNMLFLGVVGLIAVGGYTGGLLMLAGIGFWPALYAAILFSAVVGFFIALPTVRFKADFLGIVTLGFGEIIRTIILNWTSLTRGPLGLPGIPRPTIFGTTLNSDVLYLLFTTAAVVLSMSLIYRIVHSPFGKILETIREDDIASRAIGRAINTYRIIVITIAAGIIGAMGVIDVSYVRFTEPNVYNLEYLGLILLAVFGGGPGKYWGAVVAAVVTMIVREAFLLLDFSPTIIGPLRWIVLGSVLVGILIYRPNGLFGKKFIRKNY